MPVSIAKFKEIATSDEVKLLRMSRKPNVSKFSLAELKKQASRARKLHGKWHSLERSQSRARGKSVGFGESKSNTQLKVQAFREALENYDAQLSKQTETQVADKKTAKKTKKTRNAGHRATRASIRGELSAFKESLKEPARKAARKKAVKKVAAKKKAAKKTSDANSEATAIAKVAKKSVKKTPPSSKPIGNSGLKLNQGKARQAKTSAKKSRIDRSGLTSRVRGHVSARGRRAQGRKDSRG